MTDKLVRGLRLIESGHWHGLGDNWLKKTGGAGADEIERLRKIEAAARPFAEHDWMDAELENDSCKLTRHSGGITVGHWRTLRAAIAGEGQSD